MKIVSISILFLVIITTISCSTSSKTTETVQAQTNTPIHNENPHSPIQPNSSKQKAPESTNQLDQPKFTQ